MPLTTSAIVVLAAEAHAGQKDRLGQPYIWHPMRVADRVDAAGHGETAVQVALLHDVLEDGTTSHSTLGRDSDALLIHDPTAATSHRRITAADLREQGVADDVVAAVEVLTRWPGERYRDYIARVATSGNRVAIAVKLDGDLADHLDPDRAEGLTEPLLYRYQDAQWVLRAALAGLAPAKTKKESTE